MEHLVATSVLKMVEEFLRISKGSLIYTWKTCIIQHVNCKIIATFCIKICMMQFLKDWMISISSDLYEEILEVKSLRGF